MDSASFLKKHGLKEGDLVKVSSKEEEFNGTIIPSKEPETITLKLFSGYNAGFNVKNISSIAKSGEGKAVSKPPSKEITQDSSLPKIFILHTGGTIASRVDYRTGGVVSAFDPSDILSLVPELGKIARIESIFISNMFSENMRFANYQKIAQAVKKAIDSGAKGVIIGHGTDTLHYTAAALSFMLENCPVPVLLVGSQRSSDRPSSDATVNLVCAAEFAAKTDFAGVGICMHDSSSDENCVILSGTKTRKLHSTRRDAFKAVNSEPIARINYKTRKIDFSSKNCPKRSAAGKFSMKEKFEEKVGLLKIHPNMFSEQFDFFRQQKFRGLVLEGTGLGHAPIGSENPENKLNEKIFSSLKALIDSGCVVAMATQCISGTVDLQVYSTGRDLQKTGVISAKDMLSETAFIKLAWLLGNYSREEAMKLFGQNLCGEINERIKLGEFDLNWA